MSLRIVSVTVMEERTCCLECFSLMRLLVFPSFHCFDLNAEPALAQFSNQCPIRVRISPDEPQSPPTPRVDHVVS